MELVPSPIWLAEDNSEAWRSGIISAAARSFSAAIDFVHRLPRSAIEAAADREVVFTLVLCAVHPEKPFDFAGKAYWLRATSR